MYGLGREIKEKGTGTICPCTIRPRMLYPRVFASPYFSSLKCGTIFRVRLG